MIGICVGSTFDGYHSSAHPPLAKTDVFGMLRLGDPSNCGGIRALTSSPRAEVATREGGEADAAADGHDRGRNAGTEPISASSNNSSKFNPPRHCAS